jgi:uncharacterized protein YbjT (DUF2867 family)
MLRVNVHSVRGRTSVLENAGTRSLGHGPKVLPQRAVRVSGAQELSGMHAAAPQEVMGMSRRDALLSAAAGVLSLTFATNSVEAAPIAITETVLVVGATGETGRRVVKQLSAAGFKVRAGCRDIKKGQKLLGADPSVTFVKCDVLSGVDSLVEAIGDASAVICTTGYTGFNPRGFGQVDEEGTEALVEAARMSGVKKFVLLSSLLTNAPNVGQSDNPNYKFLNLLGGVLDHKRAAEIYLEASGLDYTIVRPGGLSNEPAAKLGNLIVSKEDTLFGLDTESGREISRDTVAEVMVAALVQPSAEKKIVEVVASISAPTLDQSLWFP